MLLRCRKLSLFLFATFAAFGFGALCAQEPSPSDAMRVQQKSLADSALVVELRESDASCTFALKGFADVDALKQLDASELKELLSVHVQSKASALPPPLLGTYSFADLELRFESRFPLSSSMQYVVRVTAKATRGEELVVPFQPIGKKRSTAPKVEAVYPSADVLPENLLKFYIHFSEPMSRGEAYSRIHLLNEEGVAVEDPFLELGEELWDAEQKRFTLFIHPGRIKRGVKPREDSGLPMTEGHQYALRVDQDWKSAEGQVLTESYAKKFRVVGSDESQPDPVNWKIETPKADSRQPIVLNFNEPLDHAMLKRVLVVRDIQGDAVAGEIEVSEHEKVWKFVPAKAWPRGTYAIEVATNLEDLTGNSIARPFETKMQVDSGDEIAAPTIAIEFSAE